MPVVCTGQLWNSPELIEKVILRAKDWGRWCWKENPRPMFPGEGCPAGKTRKAQKEPSKVHVRVCLALVWCTGNCHTWLEHKISAKHTLFWGKGTFVPLNSSVHCKSHGSERLEEEVRGFWSAEDSSVERGQQPRAAAGEYSEKQAYRDVLLVELATG